MRVSLVTPVFPHPRAGVYVGIERLALDLSRHLRAGGHKVRIFTTFWNGGKAVDRFDNLEIHRSLDLTSILGRSAALFDLHYVTWGWSLAASEGLLKECDVVHALAPLSSSKKMTSMGLPLVSHFQHHEEIGSPTDLLYKPFHHWLERAAYRNSTLVLAPSRVSAMDVTAKFAIPRRKIRVVPHAVDPNRFSVQPEVASRGPIRILFVGAHEPRKGLEYLLEAISILRRSDVNVKLVTVGGGSILGQLRDVAARLGISEVVEFRGYLPDPHGRVIPGMFSEADIFVLPSFREGFGLVLLEAMASGLPIVASEASAIPEVLGDAGILVPPRDAKSLADALRLLIENQGLRSELGRHGRTRVETLFSWDDVIPQIVGVYEEAIEIAGGT